MSYYKSYFSKNNTIVNNSLVNTAKNPVMELFYGRDTSNPCKYTGLSGDTCGGNTGYTFSSGNFFSRFIFDVDIAAIKEKVDSGCIILTGECAVSHTLKMTNTSSFDKDLLRDKLNNGSNRASSFILNLLKVTGVTWDEGIGYDFVQAPGMFAPEWDRTWSQRPSNWLSATTVTPWDYHGTYQSNDSSTFEVLGTQSFDNGNEDISIDMTDEINRRLTGDTSITTGITYVVSYPVEFEELTGLTESYTVGFFTKYTQTFYEPYVLTYYNDLIQDDRNQFYKSKNNKLYLYVNTNGVPTNLDNLPQVTIYDCDDVVYTSMTATQCTCGVYYVGLNVTGDTYGTPSLFQDQWSNMSIDNISLSNVTNEFTILPETSYYQIGTNDELPKEYGFSLSGIKLDEKVTNDDIRKVIVSVRVPYTVNEHVAIENLDYRLYVRQGTTEVETQPWTPVNRAFNQNYFLVDTRDMIPNEYFIDLKAISNQQVNTYRRVIKFQVVNEI